MAFIEYINSKNIKEKYNILSVDRIFGGLVHETYRITTSTEIYIVKLINEHCKNNLEIYEKSENLSNICKNNKLSVSCAIIKNGKYVRKLGAYDVLIYKYIDGIQYKYADINETMLKSIASLVGKLHKINYTDEYKKIIRHEIDWSKFLNSDEFESMSYSSEYIANYKYITSIFSYVIHIKNSKNPRLGICHRDIKDTNVIWKKNVPYLIDFESARYDDTEIDFIETALRWSGLADLNIDYKKLKTFFKVYKMYIDISDIDFKELLVSNLLGRFDFLYYNLDITLINKTTDIYLKNNAEQQVIQMIKEICYYYQNIDELAQKCTLFAK